MSDTGSRTVHVSWFSSDRRPRPDYEIDANWPGLVGLLTNPHKRRITSDLKSVPLISFARFNGPRRNESVEAITAVVLNFDGSERYETIRRYAAEYEFVAYSTHGHTEEKPKFRFIFLPTRDIAGAEWPKLYAATCAMLGNRADVTARDPACLFAVPSVPAKKRDIAFAHHNRGRLLDPDVLLSGNVGERSMMSLSPIDFAAIAEVGSR